MLNAFPATEYMSRNETLEEYELVSENRRNPMSKRMLTLVTVLLLLMVFTVAQAQETVSGTSHFAQTQGQSGGTSPYLGQIPANGFIMSDGRICNPRWGC